MSLRQAVESGLVLGSLWGFIELAFVYSTGAAPAADALPIVLAPMAVWWFFSLREPGFAVAREQKKSNFFEAMHTTIANRTFLVLTAIIFTLAMGFNFVGSLANYITIFYLYGGDVRAASPLLGITGTVWAVTALGAVFPLNWLGRRLGKNNTLLVAILLMCAAQLSKIVCYHPGPLGTIALPAGSLPMPVSSIRKIPKSPSCDRRSIWIIPYSSSAIGVCRSGCRRPLPVTKANSTRSN